MDNLGQRRERLTDDTGFKILWLPAFAAAPASLARFSFEVHRRGCRTRKIQRCHFAVSTSLRQPDELQDFFESANDCFGLSYKVSKALRLKENGKRGMGFPFPSNIGHYELPGKEQPLLRVERGMDQPVAPIPSPVAPILQFNSNCATDCLSFLMSFPTAACQQIICMATVQGSS